MSADNGVGTPAYIKGVPHPLPPGEQLLWEGAPDTRAVATHVFHWRLFAAYFAVMLTYWLVSTDTPFDSQAFVAGLGVRVGLSVTAVAIAFGLAQLVARTSWYAITSKRVVLRLGMVFPMSINIPFALLTSAGVGRYRDGTGQVLLTLNAESRVAFIALWPHCRMFQLGNPQPVLRGLLDAQRVGTLLADAVADASSGQQEAPVRRGSPRETAVDASVLPHPAGA